MWIRCWLQMVMICLHQEVGVRRQIPQLKQIGICKYMVMGVAERPIRHQQQVGIHCQKKKVGMANRQIRQQQQMGICIEHEKGMTKREIRQQHQMVIPSKQEM